MEDKQDEHVDVSVEGITKLRDSVKEKLEKAKKLISDASWEVQESNCAYIEPRQKGIFEAIESLTSNELDKLVILIDGLILDTEEDRNPTPVSRDQMIRDNGEGFTSADLER